MNENSETPKINIVYKGIKEKISDVEKKPFNVTKSEIIENEGALIWGVHGTEYLLNDEQSQNIGVMSLWEEDPILTDDVKIKMIKIKDEFQGSGAVYSLYEKALEKAKRLNKNLVLDCVASRAAFKSFQKFAKENGLTIIENSSLSFNEELNEYRAPKHEWTLKIVLND